MILKAILFTILFILIGISKALCDAKTFKGDAFIYSRKPWWDARSWRLKWKGNTWAFEPGKYKSAPWWYLWLYKPEYKERFLYSSTILVAFTDGWHFFNMLQYSCWGAMVSISLFDFTWTTLGVFIVIILIRGLVFELFYKKVFVKETIKYITEEKKYESNERLYTPRVVVIKRKEDY